MELLRIASDWHLAPGSPLEDVHLATEFLRRAHADGATVVLNGDVFDDVYAGTGSGARAHPGVAAALERLGAEGRLRRTRGNHDPGAGEHQIVLDWPGLGRVVVAHGDGVDPLHQSWLGRLGQAISVRLGTLRIVRLAMALAEATARTLAGPRMLRGYRTRCLELVAREGCTLGVFGHVHEQHLVPGDPYVNAGWLHGGRLEFLELSRGGARLCVLTLGDLAEHRAPA